MGVLGWLIVDRWPPDIVYRIPQRQDVSDDQPVLRFEFLELLLELPSLLTLQIELGLQRFDPSGERRKYPLEFRLRGDSKGSVSPALMADLPIFLYYHMPSMSL